jgi:hypothetical protein
LRFLPCAWEPSWGKYGSLKTPVGTNRRRKDWLD